MQKSTNAVCREVKIQCADEEKCSVQRSTNSLFRGVQIQCSEEEYSVLRSKNRVCREIELQYAEGYNTNTVCRGVQYNYSMQRRSWRDWYLTSGDSSQGAAPAGDPTQHTCS